MCFLALLSYYVLTELKPFESLDEVSGAEWMLIIWNISLVLEELVQVSSYSDYFPVEKFPYPPCLLIFYGFLVMEAFNTDFYLAAINCCISGSLCSAV